MTVLLIVLTLIVVAALVLAVELLRPEPVSEQGLAELNRSLAGGREYKQTAALFDENLPTSCGPVMRERLRSLRADFLAAWTVCRLLGPISQEPDSTTRLFGRWLHFHWLLAAVWLKTYGGPRTDAARQVSRLLAVFRTSRGRATALMKMDAGLATGGGRV